MHVMLYAENFGTLKASKPYKADDQELVVMVVTLHVAPNCDGSKASWLGDHNGFGMTILAQAQAQGKRVE